MPPVTNRDRGLALLLAVLVLLLGYLLLVHPWFTQPWLAMQDQVQELQQRDARIQAQIAQAPQVAKRLQQVREVLQQQPGFLQESSVELASAGLVQRLDAVVAEASPGNRSCAIGNRSPLPAQPGQRFSRVAVQVRLRCGTPELAKVLHALETGSPRLFVDNLSILPLPSLNNAEGGLDVSFELAGYLAPQSIAGGANAH